MLRVCGRILLVMSDPWHSRRDAKRQIRLLKLKLRLLATPFTVLSLAGPCSGTMVTRSQCRHPTTRL